MKQCQSSGFKSVIPPQVNISLLIFYPQKLSILLVLIIFSIRATCDTEYNYHEIIGPGGIEAFGYSLYFIISHCTNYKFFTVEHSMDCTSFPR